jgi:hypothetical protein
MTWELKFACGSHQRETFVDHSHASQISVFFDLAFFFFDSKSNCTARNLVLKRIIAVESGQESSDGIQEGDIVDLESIYG